MSQRQLLTAQSGLQQRLQEVTLEEGQKLMVGYLQERVSEVLNLMSPRRPEPQQSLNDLGFDSMRGMELRHRIMTELAVDIPLEEFIGSSTLAQVARLLLDQLVLTSVIQSAPLSPGLSDETEEITV
jgi:aryl carrier-like protein